LPTTTTVNRLPPLLPPAAQPLRPNTEKSWEQEVDDTFRLLDGDSRLRSDLNCFAASNHYNGTRNSTGR
jgi:hypothetical protein